jgi:hypothetical protein
LIKFEKSKSNCFFSLAGTTCHLSSLSRFGCHVGPAIRHLACVIHAKQVVPHGTVSATIHWSERLSRLTTRQSNRVCPVRELSVAILRELDAVSPLLIFLSLEPSPETPSDNCSRRAALSSAIHHLMETREGLNIDISVETEDNLIGEESRCSRPDNNHPEMLHLSNRYTNSHS